MHINQILKTGLNLVLQKQELKPLENGDPEEAFTLALQDTKIMYSRQEDLKEVLRLIMVKMGLRANNWPKDEEKAVLLSHIVNNYGGHTPKEILLAFEMGMADQLDFGDGESIVCYENFSCLYFSSVMNAYRRWAKEGYKMNVKEVPKLDAPKEEMSEQTYQDWYKSTAADYGSGKIKSLEFLPPMIADWLIGKGEIDPQQFVKAAAIRIGKRLAKEAEEDKGKIEDYLAFKNQYENAVKKGEPFFGTWALQVERTAKQIALSNYILQEQEL